MNTYIKRCKNNCFPQKNSLDPLLITIAKLTLKKPNAFHLYSKSQLRLISHIRNLLSKSQIYPKSHFNLCPKDFSGAAEYFNCLIENAVSGTAVNLQQMVHLRCYINNSLSFPTNLVSKPNRWWFLRSKVFFAWTCRNDSNVFRVFFYWLDLFREYFLVHHARSKEDKSVPVLTLPRLLSQVTTNKRRIFGIEKIYAKPSHNRKSVSIVN